jgi:DNA adenine methylase
VRSFLRWAGSKCQLLPVLRQYWNSSCRTYIEPFAGSATLFFDISPTRAILGDSNEELVETLGFVQTDVERILQALRRLPKGRDYYYTLRRKDPNSLAPAERAARFLYLNRYCFNGLFRTNLNGRFNVPYGKHKARVRFDEDLLIGCAGQLRNAFIVHGDFEETVRHAGKNDFVYLDPPYVEDESEGFVEYGPHSFTVKDLGRFAESLRTLDKIGAKFLVSYADTSSARQLLKRWNIRRVWTRRNIAGFADKRRGVHELLASNT